MLASCLHHRPTDEMRERQFDARGLQPFIQPSPLVPKPGDFDIAERGRSGKLERRLHVLQQPQGWASDWVDWRSGNLPIRRAYGQRATARLPACPPVVHRRLALQSILKKR